MVTIRLRARALAIAMAALFLLGACADRGPNFASVTLPPVPAEMARIYFYRLYEPYESLSRQWIYLNGRETLISVPGGVATRDVPPGAYEIYVYSKGNFPNQVKHVVLRPGDALYVRVDSLRSWWGGFRYESETLIATLVGEQQARAEMASLRYRDDRGS
jgi:hypothetical protein